MPPDLKSLSNWFGLRCAIRMCPHIPTRDGYACMICGRAKTWTGEDA